MPRFCIALLGLLIWMLCWPLAAKFDRYGSWIAAVGTLILCVGLILATR